ncbi:M43 family zinc metalloprotease [Chryseobacterium daeguense]|uniref:M43 family zinc metalloprotease n=1 Tax=Chryseobacterium daeguense TaxID=412438 RepID=UPI0004093EEA|nr:M43 family zinc metalloprotease [Chryseobacterium daeguense]
MRKIFLISVITLFSCSDDSMHTNIAQEEGPRLKIPVVVNVLYETTKGNISEEQIKSQIAVLNEDYNGKNKDFQSVPEIFSKNKASVGIEFVLVGINRAKMDVDKWDDSSAYGGMKETARGGLDPTDPTRKLNIYAVERYKDNSGAEGIGFADAPENMMNPNFNGVVVLSSAFGRTGTAVAPYNKGRVTVHEIGHWLGLTHLFNGDNEGDCVDDGIDDTPIHSSDIQGNPAFPHAGTCASVEMTMNYMCITDDVARYMFTNGQKKAILSKFTPGSVWSKFLIN